MEKFKVKLFDAEIAAVVRYSEKDRTGRDVCLLCGREFRTRIGQHLSRDHSEIIQNFVEDIVGGRYPEITAKFEKLARLTALMELRNRAFDKVSKE